MYVGNNPVLKSDPTGLCPQGDCPTEYEGTVYFRHIEGRGTVYNDVQEDESWQVFDSEVLINRDDGKGWSIINGSGWFTISNKAADNYVKPVAPIASGDGSFGRDRTVGDQLWYSLTATGKSADNLRIGFTNTFYWSVEKMSFGAIEAPYFQPWTGRNESERRSMFSADMGFLGVSLVSAGGMASGARAGSSNSAKFGNLTASPTKTAKTAPAEMSEGARLVLDWVGPNARGQLNNAGDLIISSSSRKFRVVFRNPGNDLPHMHLEELVNGKWKDAIRGTHRIYPRQR